jgi:ParB family transcriptional regulator, chromosome partitioning protein
MAEENRNRLGRGLAALLGDVGDEGAVVDRARGGPRRVPVAFLRPNPRNPRKIFKEADLESLAQSIKEKGVVQPILVRAVAGERDRYEIVAGERRWRAAQRVGLHEVPIVVIEASDRDSLEIALIENIQRADLDPLEEAQGYQALMSEFSYTQDDLAKVIGKSRSHVANTLRLLTVSDKIKAYLRDGSLSAGHARAIMNAPNAEALADKIVADGLSVRDAEGLGQVEKGVEPTRRPRAAKADKDADTKALEKALSDSLGLHLTIADRGPAGGVVQIKYRTLEQLDELCRRLQG